MKIANIAYTKNHLSSVLKQVREGETYLIKDRNEPVAILEPASRIDATGTEKVSGLAARGLVKLPAQALDAKGFLAMPRGRIKKGGDLIRAVVNERSEGR